jgi:hypothetical protein
MFKPQRWDGGEVSIGQQKVLSAASWKGLRVRESVFGGVSSVCAEATSNPVIIC